MTPDRRLDQLEPLMADSLQKTDRLIEGQGQLTEIAIRADQKADITAKGVADLTVSVNEFKQEVRGGFEQINQRIDTEIGSLHQKIDTEVGGLRQEMNQRFDQLITLIQERLS